MTLPNDQFVNRHIGPRDADIKKMLQRVGYASMDALTDDTVPDGIRLHHTLELQPVDGQNTPLTEMEALQALQVMVEQNRQMHSMIGMGYYGTTTPPIIQRNILENPGWYTQYTPYQAEIAQGRLEALLNFQTMVSDLTGLPLANASLLDEATAAAEAMAMCLRIARGKNRFFAADHCHPQSLNVLRTRAKAAGIELVIGPVETIDEHIDELAGVLIQSPDTEGHLFKPDQMADLAEKLHAAGAQLVVASDLLALCLIKPPGECGADIVVGSAQRFGVPMGFGGPHAAFMSTHEKHARRMPGRIVGVSIDRRGNPALRLAIQTREQHIRRDKATSNICTSQVLLAIMAGMYGVYHGPEGIRGIAQRVQSLTDSLRRTLNDRGFVTSNGPCFDTFTVQCNTGRNAEIEGTTGEALAERARDAGFNLRTIPGQQRVGISLDETTTPQMIDQLLRAIDPDFSGQLAQSDELPETLKRESAFLTHPVFNCYHSETDLLRYIHRLQGRDLSLAHSMIPLGSCTMKLNGTSEMVPVTWPKISSLHPYAPADQTKGYKQLFEQLESWLCEITGFEACSLQPNAGSQGEYAGLLAIAEYHEANGQGKRNICLIPISAHGTNPASAVMAGFEVVGVDCDPEGNIDIDDLRTKAAAHSDHLGALMITYPSTHGVFEEGVQEVCNIIHDHGGQVYMDGANLNAQVGLCRPGDIGADVCHLNLHKTFCIPHGGGGPGMGPICVAQHLADFLPGHPIGPSGAVGPISAAPHGSPSILPISWVYIATMGAEGLRRATQVAILNANYMAARVADHYPILFTGANDTCAHEFIIDCRAFKVSAGIDVEDIAKRLIDYGFHAPTMSWPVAGTLMIEPTESESKAELDRFCDALIAIREEIRAIELAKADRDDNPLKNAPHSVETMTSDDWPHRYSREQAAYPLPWLREHKFWPSVDRINNPHGDKNLVCACPSVEELASA